MIWVWPTIALFTLFVTQLVAIRMFGPGTNWLVYAIWCFINLIVAIVKNDLSAKISYLVGIVVGTYLWLHIGPKDKFKKLKKATSDRVKRLINAMTEEAQAGLRNRPQEL